MSNNRLITLVKSLYNKNNILFYRSAHFRALLCYNSSIRLEKYIVVINEVFYELY